MRRVRRRAIAERARDAGLGAVHRVHYERRSWVTGGGAHLLGLFIGVVVFTPLYIPAVLPFLLVGVPLLLVCWAAWVYLMPPRSLTGRRWFAVCDEGLLLWSRHNGQPAALAIPWEMIGGVEEGVNDAQGAFSFRLSWLEGERHRKDLAHERSLTVGAVMGRSGLIRALRARGALPRPVARRVVITSVALGSAAVLSWALMLLPPVNDAVLGDLPRDLRDFARICGEDGEGGGEPFPRAAPFEPGAEQEPSPWVAIEDEWDEHSATGTETAEPEWGDDEPDADTVQLVACAAVSGAVPGSDISCPYTEGPLGFGPATQSVEFAQGRYRVTVYEARTGDKVGEGVLEGEDDVECYEYVSAEEAGPIYTSPEWDAYATLLTEVQAAPAGS
ncbi:hypothetical protein [Streptomyces sp. MP131-18]|uniref:hypothetical protein n=1 Tax=Streptomyces sp. MP131-18 TaxID=1857892 RepID=UPI0009D39835|nr:hypothetical protein [Streptomyces sp. MP131-18]ONK11095.1 hypothetical protein STBA_18230 [Streptomyces sp. MP131-18]